MCHQPFENWLLENTELNPQEKRQLEEHLDTCPHCRKLQSSWQAVHVRLSTARQIEPTPGFSARWQQTLQNRLEEQRIKQVLQVRRFFLFLGTATLISLVLLILFVFLGGGLVNQLGVTVNRLGTATEWIETLEGFIFAALQIAPPAVPLVIWVTVTTIFSILALIWVVSLWRITFKGVESR